MSIVFGRNWGRIGDHDLTADDVDTAKNYRVKEHRIHEQYNNRTFAHDIAVLVLDEPVLFDCEWELLARSTVTGHWRLIVAVETSSFKARFSAMRYENLCHMVHIGNANCSEERCRF